MVKVKKNEILVLLISGIVFVVFSSVIQYIISLGTDKYMNVSTMFFLLPMVFIAFMVAVQGIGNSFNMMIGMGGTRKSYIISVFAFSFIKYGIVFMLSFLIYKLNGMMSGGQLISMDGFFRPEILTVSIFILVSAETIIGTLMLKYGMKVYWAIWLLYMMVIVLKNRMENAAHSSKNSVLKSIGKSIGEFFIEVEKYQLMCIGMAFSVVIIVVSTVILLRQDVTA